MRLTIKLALTQQKDLLPAIAVIPQMTVPTGSSTLTANQVLPGLNVDMSWEIVKNFFSIEVLVGNNEVAGKYADEIHTSHFETSTGITAVFQVTKKLEAFAEWDPVYQIDGAERGHDTMRLVGSYISSHLTSKSTAVWE